MDRTAAAADAAYLAAVPDEIDSVPLADLPQVIETMGMDMVLLNAVRIGYQDALQTCSTTSCVGAVIAIALLNAYDLHPRFHRFVSATTEDIEYPRSHRMEAFECVRDCAELEMLEQKLEERVRAGVASERESHMVAILTALVRPLSSFRGNIMRHYRCYTIP